MILKISALFAFVSFAFQFLQLQKWKNKVIKIWIIDQLRRD